MQSIKAIYKDHRYALSIGGLNDSIISVTFDTGAVNTVIAIKSICKKKIDTERLKKELDEKCECKSFYSASGTLLMGYRVCARDIEIAGVHIDRFYYYLLPEDDISVALLGDDFLSCCDFSHSVCGDILITDFNEDVYEKNEVKSLSQNELNTLLELTIES